MNYLAHILLSGPDPDWQLGGFLGDFIKGPLPISLSTATATATATPSSILDAQGSPWESGVLDGVRLHRQLDAHVDSWEDYLQCLSLLGMEHRRVGGIALDVFFDHLLVRHWSSFTDESLADFSQRFYTLCEQQRTRLPASAARFMTRAAQNDLFQGYGQRELFLPILERIDQRIRFETNLVAAGNATLDNYDALEQRFVQLMPRLMDKAEELRRQA